MELEKLAGLIDLIVDFQDLGGHLRDAKGQEKIDLLERALQALRILHRRPNNSLPLETFVQSEMIVDEKGVLFRLPRFVENLGSGTPPIQLQPALLLFLLLYHRHKFAIYDIIEKFISLVWDELDFLDFKRTQTGVMRCFTNTRFAALKLRDYGFLKSTHDEAYKTWVLSLPGFLVASEVLDTGIKWTLPKFEHAKPFDLHPHIGTVWDKLQDYAQFIRVLERVCEPNVKVFSTFGDVLAKAHQLLKAFWAALQDPNISQEDRKTETARLLKMLEEQPGMNEFYQEFSACVNVEEGRKDID